MESFFLDYLSATFQSELSATERCQFISWEDWRSFRRTQGHLYTHELFQLQCTGNVAWSKGNFLSWKEFIFCLDGIYMALITVLSKLFIIQNCIVVEKWGTLQAHMQSHMPHSSHMATVLSSATAASVAPYWGGHMGMHVFAVEDMQQLLSICMASICPCSSFSCPAAELYPGCHLDCSILDIHLACLLLLPSNCTLVWSLLFFQYVNVLSQNREKPWSRFIKPIRFLSIKLQFKNTLTHSLTETPYFSPLNSRDIFYFPWNLLNTCFLFHLVGW